MCIRDRSRPSASSRPARSVTPPTASGGAAPSRCLLYTSDAADDLTRVALGGRRFFQAEDGIRDLVRSRGLGDVYKRQVEAQRIQSARSLRDAAYGIWWGGAIT